VEPTTTSTTSTTLAVEDDTTTTSLEPPASTTTTTTLPDAPQLPEEDCADVIDFESEKPGARVKQVTTARGRPVSSGHQPGVQL
jgi:hypothetical protein